MTYRLAPERPHRTAKRPGMGWLLRAACIGLLSLALVPGAPLSAKVKIEHDPVKKSKSGHRIEIDAKIVDKKAGIRDARAYFKSGHDNRFWFAPMRPNGAKEYLAVLPAPALFADTVQYRIYAVNGGDDFVKTQIYSIEIEDDEEALERLEQKEPTDVEIDLDQIEEAYDLATQGGEPDPSSQVEVRNDVPGSENPSQLTGFQDYVVLAEAPPAAAGAGLAGATVVSAGGGIGAGAILGTTLALGGVAAGADAIDSSDDDDGGGTAPPGAQACNQQTVAGGDQGTTVNVELGQRSGTFTFEWDTESIPDRIRVFYQGKTLFNTKCVGSSGTERIPFSGSDTHVTVQVDANCSGTTGTGWSFTVHCPS